MCSVKSRVIADCKPDATSLPAADVVAPAVVFLQLTIWSRVDFQLGVEKAASQEIYAGRAELSRLNNAFIALIPKKQNVEIAKDLQTRLSDEW